MSLQPQHIVVLGEVIDEWYSDLYGSYEGDATDPTGTASGVYRVLRGGSWGSFARDCRSAYRGGDTPDSRLSYLGGWHVLTMLKGDDE